MELSDKRLREIANSPLIFPHPATNEETMEMARQLVALRERYRVLQKFCPRCQGEGWICIHCDKALGECHCPDDGSQNVGTCPVCF